MNNILKITPIRIEEGNPTVCAMRISTLADIVSILQDLVPDGVSLGVNGVFGHGQYKLGHLEIWIHGWSSFCDWANTANRAPHQLLDELASPDGSRTETERIYRLGMTFLGSILLRQEEFSKFVESDALNLIAQY